MEQLALIGGALVMAAAALAAARALYRALRQAFRWLDAIHELTARELTHNHGSSIKDDTHGMAVALGEVQRRVDELETDFRDHLRESLDAQITAQREATQALARSAPAVPERKGRSW